MKMKYRIAIILLVWSGSFSFGQIDEFQYKRELNGIKDQWHKLVLPLDVFGKLSPNLGDIRIYGITSTKDTIEAPYMLQQIRNTKIDKTVPFKLLNSSYNEKGHYYTFEVPTQDALNELNLDFGQQNFDWQLKLEGSNNQQEWYTIVDDYRILSIQNSSTHFQFTKVTFPNSKYRYFRILIKSEEKPELSIAKITHHEMESGAFNVYPIKSMKSFLKKDEKQTEVEIELNSTVPVNSIQLYVQEKFDYYRPITLEYLADSIQTEKGWKYQYAQLCSGILTSSQENVFQFASTLLRKMRIRIYNQDNQPLTVGSIEASGFVHELLIRFTEPAKYYLCYGNSEISQTNYDIGRFEAGIPEELALLTLGPEKLTDKKKIQEKAKIQKEPLFKNKLWLWAILIIIILLLGGFTLKMIQSK